MTYSCDFDRDWMVVCREGYHNYGCLQVYKEVHWLHILQLKEAHSETEQG